MPSANRDKIVEYCNTYLKVATFTDYCQNGLQVEGSPTVQRAVSGVSFSMELIRAAIRRKAQMLLVHHGIFGNDLPSPPQIRGVLRDRLKLLLQHDISLCGYHLPLDAHPLIGNNISLCKLLGVKKATPLCVGFVGDLEAPMQLAKFVDRVELKLDTRAQVIAAGPTKIRRVAIISGGSSFRFAEAARAGAQAYVCGDLKENVVRAAEETGITIINAGHYNTEKLGIQNLGKLITRKFRIPIEFVDIPCEV
ncbi:MAG: Nif3-like dinuclear metal center hexameric protein [Deltaproteobacteria bacterium]|nr:Nif3-like dinuclear metal center hexameric protein [Deltaproteobacteria bacterium]